MSRPQGHGQRVTGDCFPDGLEAALLDVGDRVLALPLDAVLLLIAYSAGDQFRWTRVPSPEGVIDEDLAAYAHLVDRVKRHLEDRWPGVGRPFESNLAVGSREELEDGLRMTAAAVVAAWQLCSRAATLAGYLPDPRDREFALLFDGIDELLELATDRQLLRLAWDLCPSWQGSAGALGWAVRLAAGLDGGRVGSVGVARSS